MTEPITEPAQITGTQHQMLDPDAPWHEGYRLSGTWPEVMAR